MKCAFSGYETSKPLHHYKLFMKGYIYHIDHGHGSLVNEYEYVYFTGEKVDAERKPG